jgi:uncharacterized SAM-binding protein YcdF (DUF218 family)
MLKLLFDWLTRADPPARADAIFVLAGLKSRKLYAIQLMQQSMAPRVLFSVGRFEIRRFPELGLPQTIDLLTLAQSIPPPQRHFFVLFENQQFTVQRMPLRILGTLSEIDALVGWIRWHPEISSLLVVSSATHLRRLRICCRALLPHGVRTSFLAAAGEGNLPDPRKWWGDVATRKMVLSECFKIACYFLFMPFWKLARLWRSKTIPSTTLS